MAASICHIQRLEEALNNFRDFKMRYAISALLAVSAMFASICALAQSADVEGTDNGCFDRRTDHQPE
jgi:hypothetical protein